MVLNTCIAIFTVAGLMLGVFGMVMRLDQESKPPFGASKLSISLAVICASLRGLLAPPEAIHLIWFRTRFCVGLLVLGCYMAWLSWREIR